MDVRVNLMMPEYLYKESMKLVEKGLYANYSELVRQSVRETMNMERAKTMTERDKALFDVLKVMDKRGEILSEKDMAERGLILRH
jgi:Arc/MetJ-type ribon-helix-helix transcriptional regulator